MLWEVKDVVCDYGLYENGELKLILNQKSNALKIKEILEKDHAEQMEFQSKLIEPNW